MLLKYSRLLYVTRLTMPRGRQPATKDRPKTEADPPPYHGFQRYQCYHCGEMAPRQAAYMACDGWMVRICRACFTRWLEGGLDA